MPSWLLDPDRTAMKKYWFGAMVVGIALAASLAFARPQEPETGSPAQTEAAGQTLYSGQPIAFPHDRHAGDLQIDCQYCHFSAERSQSAGIPPVATCMGCHAFVSGSQNPDQISILRGYAEVQQPIPWNRVYDLPDHVQFPHMRHIAAGVDCASCHGNVREVGVIQEVNQSLTMGWCVGCHLEQEASRDCTVCHY